MSRIGHLSRVDRYALDRREWTERALSDLENPLGMTIRGIHDKLESRFTLFVTLTVGGLGLLQLPALLRRRWLALALVVPFAEPTLRLAKNTIRGRGPRSADFRSESLEGFAPSLITIDPEHVGRAPEASSDFVLVSPPYPRKNQEGLRLR